MKTTLILIQAVSFLAYVLYVSKYRPYSISHSWYILQEKNKGFLFTFFTWSIGLPMLFYAGMFSNVLFFLSGSLLCFVGVATEFKRKLSGRVHNMAAIGSIILGLSGVCYEGSWSGFFIFAGVAIVLVSFVEDRLTWWIEVAAFVSIMVSIVFI